MAYVVARRNERRPRWRFLILELFHSPLVVGGFHGMSRQVLGQVLTLLLGIQVQSLVPLMVLLWQLHLWCFEDSECEIGG